MGFYSSAQFYRPGKPPRVTAAELASFLRGVLSTPLAADDGFLLFKVNWAERIDGRVKPWYRSRIGLRARARRFLASFGIVHPTSWIEYETAVKPDFELKSKGHDQVGLRTAVAELASFGDRRIGRALIAGNLDEELTRDLGVPPAPDDHRTGFYPFHWSVELGPIEVRGLSDEFKPTKAGWMAFDINGDGYFYPWLFAEWVERCGDHELFTPIKNLCRETWPVLDSAPSSKLVELRLAMDDLWPYDDVHAPADWCWGPSET